MTTPTTVPRTQRSACLHHAFWSCNWIKFISKTPPHATSARVEVASAQADHAPTAYLEDALLYIPGRMGRREWPLLVSGERPSAAADGNNTTEECAGKTFSRML